MTMAEQIKKTRKASKLTQAGLAEKADISLMSIRRYESGKSSPKIKNLQKIADALNVSLVSLL